MSDALLSRAHHLRLGLTQCVLGDGHIARSDCFLDLAHIQTHARAAALVDNGAARDLARGFLCRLCIRHSLKGFPRGAVTSGPSRRLMSSKNRAVETTPPFGRSL